MKKDVEKIWDEFIDSNILKIAYIQFNCLNNFLQ